MLMTQDQKWIRPNALMQASIISSTTTTTTVEQKRMSTSIATVDKNTTNINAWQKQMPIISPTATIIPQSQWW